MIKKVWNSYINWLLKYLDTDNGINQFKMGIIQFLTMGIVGILGIMLFYFIFETSSLVASFVVGAGYGRLLFDWKLEKYDKNYPYDKRYTPFLRFLSYSAILFVTIGGTIMLIKDAYENNTDVQKLIEEKYNTKIEQNEIIKEDKKIVMPLNVNPKSEELKLK